MPFPKIPLPNWFRRISFLGYHHILMILLTIATVLFSLLLSGCAAESTKAFHLLSLTYTGSAPLSTDDTITNANASSSVKNLVGNGTALEVRVGYFGYCLINNGTTICSSDAASLATSVLAQGTSSSDPLNLLYIAQQFHDGTIFSGLIFISVIFGFFCFCLLATFPGWHTEEGSDGSDREVKPFPSRRVSTAALLFVAVASLFGLIGALWQHLSGAATISMVGALTYGAASGQVGAAAMAFGWVGTALQIVVFIGLLVMILSMAALDALAL